jgi:hypothetical protein
MCWNPCCEILGGKIVTSGYVFGVLIFYLCFHTQAINAMNLLWSFEFSPAKDANGQEIRPDIWNYAQVHKLFFFTVTS